MTAMESNMFATQAQNALMAGQSGASLGHARTMEEARKVAQEFEAVFIGQMLQPLFKNLDAEEPFGGGSSEDMWRSLQVDEYGKAMTKAGGIGLTDAILREIIKMQELQ